MILKIAVFFGISILMYFGIAAGLIWFGVPNSSQSSPTNLSFEALRLDYSTLPPLTPFRARDGNRLFYRRYPAASERVFILIHGSGWHSRYLLPLASAVSAAGVATVITPDLRGHGAHPERRGDVDYVGQLEDDLADLLDVIRKKDAPKRIIMGGHSSGGGLALRFAGSEYGGSADGFLLLAPFLRYDAPTVRKNSGGWATPFTGRIIGLTMLGNVGIHRFDDLKAISFNLPKAYRDGTETLSYTHRLNTACAPDDYKRDLAAIRKPLKVIVGGDDEAFFPEKFAEAIRPYADADISIVPDVNHLGVVLDPSVVPVVTAWLKQI